MTDENIASANVVPLRGATGTAPIANVQLCASTLRRAVERPAHLPGMVCFFGPSGFGKSVAACYAANKTRAYYVMCQSSWTRRALMLHILREMGVQPAKNIYEMAEQAANQLTLSGRPLIIDELDHVVSRGMVELIRDIHESSNAGILLIGEESLPVKLRRWERFHGRVLHWQPALPASLDDAAKLRDLYCRKVEVAHDLLKRIHELSRGSVRRVCVNLDLIQETSIKAGLSKVDLAAWGDRELFTGEAPARKV